MVDMNLCMVLLVAAVGRVQADWYTDPEWSFQTYLGEDFEIHCNDTTAKPMDGDRVEWHSPKGEMIMDSTKYSLMDAGNVRALTLMIKDVQNEDSGLYVCMIFRNNNFHVKLNRGINMHEPKYRDPLDKYRYNILVGGVAAAALFVPLCVMCFVYKARYRTPEEVEASRNKKMMLKNRHAQDVEAGALPSKTRPQNGSEYVNQGYNDESTKL